MSMEPLDTEGFVPFPKIARLSREAIYSEKIDGLTFTVDVPEDGDPDHVRIGQHNGWITKDHDTYGLWKWAHERIPLFLEVGPGKHSGEFFGRGIGRGYGLDYRTGLLFNNVRFCKHGTEPLMIGEFKGTKKYQTPLPEGLDLVPVLHRGVFSTEKVDTLLERLKEFGSYAVPGYPRPEGVVVFHVQGNVGFKKTLDKQDNHKWEK